MNEVVNLRQARKRKLRADKEQQAAANRTKFGRTQTEKDRANAEAEHERRRLDQSKLARDE